MIEYVRGYFCCEDYSPLTQILVSFASGLAFAPLKGGFFWTVIFIIIYEIILIYFTGMEDKFWQLETRAGVIFAALAGWLIGREIANLDVMCPGKVPFREIEK